MIGERIKSEMEKAGFDVDAFSAKTDISVSTLYRIFGKDNCEIAQLRRICEVLNLPITYFIDEKSEISEKRVSKKEKDDNIFLQLLSEKDKLLQEKDKMIEELKKDKSDLKNDKSNLTKKVDDLEKIVFTNILQQSKYRTNEFGDCGRIEDDWFPAVIANDHDSVPSAAVVSY